MKGQKCRSCKRRYKGCVGCKGCKTQKCCRCCGCRSCRKCDCRRWNAKGGKTLSRSRSRSSNPGWFGGFLRQFRNTPQSHGAKTEKKRGNALGRSGVGVKRSPSWLRAAAERRKTRRKLRQQGQAAKDSLFTGAFASRRGRGLKNAAAALKYN